MTDAADADYQKVAIACAAIVASGRYPSVTSVQEHMRSHLGGGLKTARISGLIRRWETESKAIKRLSKTSALPEPPPPSLDNLLEQHPDLLAPLEAAARAMAAMLTTRAQQAADERVAAIQHAVDDAREAASKRLAEAHVEFDKELAERDAVIEALRAQEVALGEQIDELKTAADANEIAIERAGQDLALAKGDARAAHTKVGDLEAKLVAAQAQLVGAEEHGATVERELAQASAEAAGAQQALAATGEARSQLAGLVDSLRDDMRAERERNDALNRRIETLAGELATAQAKAANIV